MQPATAPHHPGRIGRPTLARLLAILLLWIAASSIAPPTWAQATPTGTVGWFGVQADAHTGWYVNSILASKHFTARKQGEWNERHHGLAIGYALNRDWRGEVGRYKNSFANPSRYLAGCYTPLGNNDWRAGACAMVVDGYTLQNPGKWKPGAALALRYQPGPWFAGLLWAPKAPSAKPEQDNSAVTVLTVGANFW